MRLVQQHIIKSTDNNFKAILEVMHLSKNLYNVALYNVRQHFFLAKNDSTVKYKYLNYYSNYRKIYEDKSKDYFALESHIAQEVLRQVDSNFKGFFALLQKKKEGSYTEKVNIPKYIDKDGYNIIVISQFKHLALRKRGVLSIPKTKIEIYLGEQIKLLEKCIKQFRLSYKNGYILLEVVYEKADAELKNDNCKYLSIDLGVDNLATCTSNCSRSFIIDGKKAKSINQFYNKKLAKLKSETCSANKQKTSKRIARLHIKRNNKIKDYFHKASRHIVNQAVEHSLNTIVIGYNKGWKQEASMSKASNQKFVFLAHAKLVQMISYKAQLAGINVIMQEESYTSKASFIDNDNVPVLGKNDKCIEFSGKRVKRGLYKTKDGRLLNADINGSFNILRKYLKVPSDAVMPACRGFMYNPVRVYL